MDLFNLSKPLEPNAGGGGGIVNELLLAKLDDIMLPLPGRGADGVTIADDIMLKSGKKFHRLYVTNKTLEPSQKRVSGSNADCYGYEVGVTGFFPGLGKKILSFLALHGSFTGLIILRSIGADGAEERFLLGDSATPVELSDTDTKWGKLPNEDKGTTLTFKGTQKFPLAIYEGELVMTEDAQNADVATVADDPN
ncbi:MAG: hypothetical protein LBL94_05340 [Prevotellaceae bacterium]|jgi:hypothetical protein|nr:hypothetical protein [Prevotellaceae bacterium]